MSKQSANLKLFEYEETDKDMTFNIKTSMNDNWDKIDQKANEIDQNINNLEQQLETKVNEVEGKGLSTEDYTTEEKTKLSGIEEGATNYKHPATHPATMITEDSNHRFVTDIEKDTWNSKANQTEVDNLAAQMAELTDEIATHKAEKAHYPVRQPTSFQGSPDDVAVNLSWTNPDDLMVKDINNNDIILAEFKEVEIKRDGSIIYTGTAENFTDTGLTNYQEYTYEIISVTTGRVRSEPATANVTPVPYTMDYAVGVSNFKVVGATESGGQAQISWTDPTDTSFAGVLIRRSETTYPATINEGVEVYNGTGESVTDTGLVNEQTYFYTIWAYSTKNAYSDDTNKQAGLAEVMQGQDGSGSPGSAVLIEGDMEEGFFGEVSANQFITGDSLASLVGISAGTSQFSDGGWLKFAWKGNVQFIAKKPIRNSISWDAINAAKCVYGDSGDKTVEIGGLTYKVRLMRALEQSNDPKATASANAGTVNHYSEWNRLMCQIHEQAISKSWDYPDNIENDIDILEHNLGNGTQGMYNDDDVVVKSGDGRYSWCQEMGTSTSHRLIRGLHGVSYSNYNTSSSTISYCGWRPVLELVP